VNQAFYAQYPDQEGRSLTLKAEDENLRRDWNRIGLELLGKLETLSQPARDRLGKYSISDFRQWKRDLQQQNLNSQNLTELSDEQFFTWFPDQRNQDLTPEMDQVWYAIAFDKFTALQNQN
jgi:serine/threonine-protein kinase